MLGVLAVLVLTASVDASAASAAIAAGDAQYVLRHEGAQAGVARPQRIDAAIEAYRKAVQLDPSSLDARLRLLRAYFFRGGFCGTEPRDAIPIFDTAKDLAEETVTLLDSRTGRWKGRVDPKHADGVPDAAAVYLWAAVSWGQWAVAHPAAGAWRRAPARIRDLALAVIALDPAAEQAGGHVLLGRLNTEAPRVPFVTMWVDRAAGLGHLRTAYALSPESPQIMYFLADALLRLDPSKREEAVALLRRCATLRPRPEYPVEDEHYAWEARDRLADLGAGRR